MEFGTVDWDEYLSEEQRDEQRVRFPDNLPGLVKKEMKMIYHYNPSTNEGVCNGLRIYVDSSYCVGKNWGEQLHHPNYLGVKFINHPERQIVHKGYDQSFKDYIREGTRCYEYKLLRVKNCVELTYKWIMPEKVKQIIRDMLSFICDMHYKRKCLSHFDERHLAVTFNGDLDKKVVFWNIEFVDFTIEGWAKDMRCLYDVIRGLFGRAHMPKDMEDFMQLLITRVGQNWFAMEFYMKKHLAILTVKERILFMRNCYDMRNSITKEDVRVSYNMAMRDFHRDLDGEWRKRLERKALGSLKSCFHHNPNPKDEKSTSTKEKKTIPYSDLTCVDLGIIRFIRNAAAHLPDHIITFKDYDHPLKDSGLKMDVEVDASIMYLFQKELLKLQRYLHDRHLLREIHG